MIRILNGLSTPQLEEPSAREFEPPPPLQPDPQALEKERTVILEAIGADPVAVDELIRGCQLSSPIVATVLLEAELAGVIDRHPGNRVSRRLEISE